MLLRVVSDGVLVSAENVDGIAADSQARPRNLPTVNGVAHCSVGRAGAFRSHIALSCETCHQVVAGSERGHDGSLRHRLLDCLQVFRSGMKKKMHMRINQSGQ